MHVKRPWGRYVLGLSEPARRPVAGKAQAREWRMSGPCSGLRIFTLSEQRAMEELGAEEGHKLIEYLKRLAPPLI